MKLSRVAIIGLCVTGFAVFLSASAAVLANNKLDEAAENQAQQSELSVKGKIQELQRAYILKKLAGELVIDGIQINVNDNAILEGLRSFDELDLGNQVAVIYYHSGDKNIAKKIIFIGGEKRASAVSINTDSQEIVTDTKEGDIALTEVSKDEGYSKRIAPLTLGRKVPAEFYIYLQEGEISKEITVVASIPYTQKSAKGVHVAFHAIFYDSTGNIVGTVSSHAGTKPDYQYALQSNTDGIPLKRIQEIKSFKLIYYQWGK